MPEGGASRGTVDLELDIPPLQFRDATKLLVYPDCVIVHELAGYIVGDGPATKQLGRRLGLYHPITSAISILDDFEWTIFDALSAAPALSLRCLEERYDPACTPVRRVLEEFRQAGLLLEQGEQFDLEVRQQFQTSELYVNTTQMCNFACPGCATASDVIPLREARTLDRESIALYLTQFVQACAERGINEVRVKWAGGEPLLKPSYAMIVAAQDVVERLRREHPDMHIEQTILTNGALLADQHIAFARAHDMHVSVSLWGIGALQDALRRPRGRKGTFPVIIDAIRKLHEAGVTYNINHVLTPGNAAQFADFITMLWDIDHPTFVARDWHAPRPLPVGVNFFRPQHAMQRAEIAEGYRLIEQGLRRGFARMLEMIQRGIALPPLHSIDYLDLFKLTLTPCGSGFNYVAVGAQGAVPCHEDLYAMRPNRDRIQQGENLFEVANEPYQAERDLLLGPNIRFEDNNILMWHGGQGCPRLARAENNGHLGVAASTSRLYLAIYEELLALESMRQLALTAHA
jgi:hypothetical protein